VWRIVFLGLKIVLKRCDVGHFYCRFLIVDFYFCQKPIA
jgi:hypothetical protein